MTTSNPIDRNASSANRVRRNFQRLKKGGITPALLPGDTSLKLIGANLAVNVNPTGGLQTTSAGLGILCAPNGGVEITASGIVEYGLRSAATSPLLNDGDAYYDTTMKQAVVQVGGYPQNDIGGLYVNTGPSNTVGNTTVETTYNTTFTLPANWFTVGRALRLYIAGTNGFASNVARSLIIRVYLGPLAQIAAFLNVPASTSGGGSFVQECYFTCQAAGSSGLIALTGVVIVAVAGVPAPAFPNGLTNGISNYAFDTTQPTLVKVTGQWGTAVSGDTSEIVLFSATTSN